MGVSRDLRIQVVGAGPSGMAAALAARARGAHVVVHEKHKTVGGRFHGDFQGLENWTRDGDVLEEFVQLGLGASYEHVPVDEVVCYDSRGREYRLRSQSPLLYLVRRGDEPGTLDRALEAQAVDADVEFRFGSRRRTLTTGGVVAAGPHRADAIAVGYVFETDMADGIFAAASETLAPGGYSYLLINAGRGTVATCMFDRFHEEQDFLDRTIEFFRDKAGLRWSSAKPFGGVGNFAPVKSAERAGKLYVGEAAGFQDALFGFGLRYAMLSGYFAGTTLASGDPTEYRARWRRRLAPLSRASVFNRWAYARLGDRGRDLVISRYAKGRDLRAVLASFYAPSLWKQSLSRVVPQPGRLLSDKIPANCSCTWCRCRTHGCT